MAPPPPRPLRYTRLRRARLIAPAGSSAAPPHARVALSRLDVNNAVLTAHSALFFASAIDPDALEASLSDALRLFPPLAGRVRPAPRCDAAERAAQGLSGLDIHCCGSGAAFDVFSCDGSLSDFDASSRWHAAGEHTQPQSNTTPPAFIPPLSPLLLRLGRTPLLAARLTRLACGGCVLGVSFAHIACDGTAAAAFMAAWAQAHHAAGIAGRMPRAMPDAASVPEFSRTALVSAVVAASDGGRDAPADVSPAARMAAAVTAAGAVARMAKLTSDFATRRTATITLRVPAAAAARARARGEAATGERLSVNDVAVGLAWALLRRCRARGPAGAPRLQCSDNADDSAQPVQFMTQAADLRRLLPALPPSYAGNAVHALLMSGSADDASCPLRAAAASAAALRRAREAGTADIAAQLRSSLGLSTTKEGAATSSSWRLATSAAVLPHFGDGIFSSWFVPALWRLRWGGSGAVRWSYVSVFPAAPWTFGAVAGPPGADGASHDLLLMVNVPAGRKEAVAQEAQRLLGLAAGPEPGDAEAPPAE